MKSKALLIFWGRFSFLILFMALVFGITSCQKDNENLKDHSLNMKNATITQENAAIYWGHEIFTRTSGKPVIVTRKIGSSELENFESNFIIHIQNGDGNKNNLVSSAIIKLDGKEIFGTSDFSQKIKSLSKEITGLTLNSELEVVLLSAPGSFLDIWIEGVLKPVQNLLFEDSFNDLSKWNLWGAITPVYIPEIYGRSGIFDNMGGADQNSGALSKEYLAFSSIKTVEADVYLDFSNPDGCWAEATIGIADPTLKYGECQPIVSMRLIANGAGCPNASYAGHTTVTFRWRYNDEGDYQEHGGILADSYKNKWVTLKIELYQNGYASCYIDNIQYATSYTPFPSSVRNGSFPLLLGNRSSGIAGKAYHDNIRVSGF